MKLYIPSLGDQLTLTADWTFTVYYEMRNQGLTDLTDIMEDFASSKIRVKYQDMKAKYPKPFTFPAGTILSVERIYIRRGAEDFNSVTFRVQSTPDERFKRKVRFWAKLEDVNRIEFSN